MNNNQQYVARSGSLERMVRRLIRKTKCFFGKHAWLTQKDNTCRKCIWCGKYQTHELVDWGRQKMWITISPRKQDQRCFHGRLLNAGCADCNSMMRGLINNNDNNPRR